MDRKYYEIVKADMVAMTYDLKGRWFDLDTVITHWIFCGYSTVDGYILTEYNGYFNKRGRLVSCEWSRDLSVDNPDVVKPFENFNRS